ncbi:MAG: DUF6361 family protein [bacterium]|nr:DUF6361 family protein [bacterium]
MTWLDYSERDRRRAFEVIDLFRETSTVDELGLGSVRNSFSDLFFPGTSTVQTRACYFLLVPWTFLRLERLGFSSSEVARRARRAELNLSRRMLAGNDTRGVFGSQAGDALKRLPSEVYWGGLRSWGICTFPGHKWGYFRSLDGFYRRGNRFRSTPRDPEGRRAPPANWHPHLPAPPSGFPYENVSVALRFEDAEYLRDRIQARHPETLLAALAARANRADLDVHRPWQLSQLREIAPVLRRQLEDAELFAVCMQGAVLLYNLMLSELRQHEEWTEDYRRRLEDWATDVDELVPTMEDWNPGGIWWVVRATGRSLGYPTRAFIQRWVEDLKQVGPRALVAEDSSARTLVRDREVQLKRARARLTNPRRLELWGGDSGTGRMGYRWGPAKRILEDLFDGLARSEGDAGNA